LTNETESPILRILRDMRAEISTIRETMATKDELRSVIHSLRADVSSDLALLDAKIDRTRKELSDQIVGLRRAVVEYHTSVVGHGVLIGEMEGRLRRVEQTLGLSPEAG
jgi:hypothetical protein